MKLEKRKINELNGKNRNRVARENSKRNFTERTGTVKEEFLRMRTKDMKETEREREGGGQKTL